MMVTVEASVMIPQRPRTLSPISPRQTSPQHNAKGLYFVLERLAQPRHCCFIYQERETIYVHQFTNE